MIIGSADAGRAGAAPRPRRVPDRGRVRLERRADAAGELNSALATMSAPGQRRRRLPASVRPPRACGLFARRRRGAVTECAPRLVAWILRDLGVYALKLSDDMPGFGLVMFGAIREHGIGGSDVGGRGLRPSGATYSRGELMTHPDLAGKAAIVTGAGAGIGFAVAERLAAEGCSVLCADIDGRCGRSRRTQESVLAQSVTRSMSATSNR